MTPKALRQQKIHERRRMMQHAQNLESLIVGVTDQLHCCARAVYRRLLILRRLAEWGMRVAEGALYRPACQITNI